MPPEPRPTSRAPAGPKSGPSRIGAYRILGELGRGGMGVVYLAERDDGQFRRRVALKLIPGDATTDTGARIIAERQILASLDHPSIARLLDGGVTDDGRPYLVLEYVEGLPIDTFCDRMRLSIEERLRLFLRVTRAVEHAHRNLVVHRDLKPSNIFVTAHGEPKLLDFGIAKLLNPALGPANRPTTLTGQRPLTPEFASPEQVRGTALTTASDVYSLGVVLYGLLTGRRPYAVDAGSMAEIVRVVCEVDPERPSTRVRRAEPQPVGPGGSSTPRAVAEARRTTPDRLTRTLRGDLDAIVLKALRKEPSRRYGSAELLAGDIEAYLDDRPVQARRGSRAYHLRKLVRRRRVETVAAALVVLSLLGGAGIAIWQAGVAGRERDRAREAQLQSDQVASFLASLFEASAPDEQIDASVTARDLLRRGVDRVDDLAGAPLVQARMLDVMVRVHRSMGLYPDARELAERAVATRRAALGEDHPDVARSMLQLADALRLLSRYDSATAVLRHARDIQVRTLGPDHPDVGLTLNSLAGLAVYHGDLIEAERLARRALDLHRARLGDDDERTINSLALLGRVLRRRGLFDEAESALAEVVERRRRLRGEDDADVGGDLIQLADLLMTRSQWDRAEPLLRRAVRIHERAYGPRHPARGWSLASLSTLLEQKGDIAAADSLLREDLELQRRAYGESHPGYSIALGNYATFLLRNGRYEAAEAAARRSLDLVAASFGEDHPVYAGALATLASIAMERGRLDEAERLYRRVIAQLSATNSPEHGLVAIHRTGLARVLLRERRYDEAERTLDEALAIARRYLVPDHPIIAEIEQAYDGLPARNDATPAR